MPSPFLGMDPYLEASQIWEDFHHGLTYQIRAQLTPFLRPKYFAAVEPRVTYDLVAIEKTKLVKPDVGLYEMREAQVAYRSGPIAPPPLIAETFVEEEIKLWTIEIKEVAEGRLVTSIEILSPVNKRRGHDAYQTYQAKRWEIIRSYVHLLEIDLLRAGRRWPLVTPLPAAPYFIFLSRSGNGARVETWPLSLREPIPIVPVPLRKGDPDVPLDLNQAIRVVYDSAAYDMRIKYAQPPPKPDLSMEDAMYVDQLLRQANLR